MNKQIGILFSCVLVIALALLSFRATTAQNIPGLPSGISIPGMSGGASGFAGAGALTAAKELSGMKDKTTYPTANIAVSGNHIVIAWPNGVVTVEHIAPDGTLTRNILGPPTESNIRK
jgi:hypothetical protein